MDYAEIYNNFNKNDRNKGMYSMSYYNITK